MIDTEQKALAPKAPVLVTAKQIQGLEDIWQDALSGNLPYLIVNDDPSAPQPQRLNAGIMDKGASEAALMCVDEIKSTTGIYSASLGDRDNETSGRAILAQQRKSDIGNFTFIDNVARAIKYTGLVILDLIPKSMTRLALFRLWVQMVNKNYSVLTIRRMYASFYKLFVYKITTKVLRSPSTKRT